MASINYSFAQCPTLGVGSNGPIVGALQAALNAVNRQNVVTLTGTYDTPTVAAVTTFQQVNGLTADGIVGPFTYLALDNQLQDLGGSFNCTAFQVGTGAPVHSFDQCFQLGIGSTGDEVLAVQEAINALGYGPIGIDGIYGPQTQGAVMGFQTANGLTADGIVGQQTLTALNTALQAIGGMLTCGVYIPPNATTTSPPGTTMAPVTTTPIPNRGGLIPSSVFGVPIGIVIALAGLGITFYALETRSRPIRR